MPLYAQPYTLRALATGPRGIVVSQTDARVLGPSVAGDRARTRYYLAPFTVALGVTAAEASQTALPAVRRFEVEALDTFAARIHFPLAPTNASTSASASESEKPVLGGASLRVPVVRGMAYVTAEFTQATPVIFSEAVVLTANGRPAPGPGSPLSLSWKPVVTGKPEGARVCEVELGFNNGQTWLLFLFTPAGAPAPHALLHKSRWGADAAARARGDESPVGLGYASALMADAPWTGVLRLAKLEQRAGAEPAAVVSARRELLRRHAAVVPLGAALTAKIERGTEADTRAAERDADAGAGMPRDSTAPTATDPSSTAVFSLHWRTIDLGTGVTDADDTVTGDREQKNREQQLLHMALPHQLDAMGLEAADRLPAGSPERALVPAPVPVGGDAEPPAAAVTAAAVRELDSEVDRNRDRDRGSNRSRDIATDRNHVHARTRGDDVYNDSAISANSDWLTQWAQARSRAPQSTVAAVHASEAAHRALRRAAVPRGMPPSRLLATRAEGSPLQPSVGSGISGAVRRAAAVLTGAAAVAESAAAQAAAEVAAEEARMREHQRRCMLKSKLRKNKNGGCAPVPAPATVLDTHFRTKEQQKQDKDKKHKDKPPKQALRGSQSATVTPTSLWQRSTTKGPMRGVIGGTWRLREPLPAPAATALLPARPPRNETARALLDALDLDLGATGAAQTRRLLRAVRADGVYTSGKELWRHAQLCLTQRALLSQYPPQSESTLTERLAVLRDGGDAAATRAAAEAAAPGARATPLGKGDAELRLRRCVAALALGLGHFPRGANGNPLVWDTTWGGVAGSLGLGTNADPLVDFGSSYYNDHHFHYGYVVAAAAALESLSPGWAARPAIESVTDKAKNKDRESDAAAVAVETRTKPHGRGSNGEWVDALLRDVANPSDSSSSHSHQTDANAKKQQSSVDTYFPRLRNMDVFAGHSWSQGLFGSFDGKDLESTSEEVHFHYAVALWGRATQRPAVELLGRALLAVAARGFRRYFYIAPETVSSTSAAAAATGTNITGADALTVHPARFARNWAPGITFEGKVDYATWFGINPEYIHGIQMLPVSPALAFTRPRAHAAGEWAAVVAPVAAALRTAWAGVLWQHHGVTDPRTAFTHLGALLTHDRPVDNGMSRTWALLAAATAPEPAAGTGPRAWELAGPRGAAFPDLLRAAGTAGGAAAGGGAQGAWGLRAETAPAGSHTGGGPVSDPTTDQDKDNNTDTEGDEDGGTGLVVPVDREFPALELGIPVDFTGHGVGVGLGRSGDEWSAIHSHTGGGGTSDGTSGTDAGTHGPAVVPGVHGHGAAAGAPWAALWALVCVCAVMVLALAAVMTRWVHERRRADAAEHKVEQLALAGLAHGDGSSRARDAHLQSQAQARAAAECDPHASAFPSQAHGQHPAHGHSAQSQRAARAGLSAGVFGSYGVGSKTAQQQQQQHQQQQQPWTADAGSGVGMSGFDGGAGHMEQQFDDRDRGVEMGRLGAPGHTPNHSQSHDHSQNLDHSQSQSQSQSNGSATSARNSANSGGGGGGALPPLPSPRLPAQPAGRSTGTAAGTGTGPTGTGGATLTSTGGAAPTVGSGSGVGGAAADAEEVELRIPLTPRLDHNNNYGQEDGGQNQAQGQGQQQRAGTWESQSPSPSPGAASKAFLWSPRPVQRR